ncbi:MAG: hypothetical protein QOF76_2285 [Solirubrobacteraceae bacterium]|jgi:molybdopterin/thiamine biosynthesis adenylyltransferase|nr:hypothetical protein [Solirubrobacteraceae bacterium]
MSSNRRGLFRLGLANAAKAIPDNILPEIVDAAPPGAAKAPLTDEEIERYSRQLVMEGWGEAQQMAVRDASVLVIGAGALGSPVAAYLAGAGVGRIGIVDDDIVELSNLARQHLHFTADLEEPKAHSAVAKLQLLNPEVMVEPYQVAINESNAEGLIVGHDIVIDCTDSFESRYLINAACCKAGVRLVEGGVAAMGGIVMSIDPGVTACYECAFPSFTAIEKSCAELGVLGPAAGVVGSLQALEALKLLTGLQRPLLNSFVNLDLATMTFVRVMTQKRADCDACGVG